MILAVHASERFDPPGKVEPLRSTNHLVNLSGASFGTSYCANDGG